MATPLPANEAPFTVEEILAATGGSPLRRDVPAAVGVCTDSRAVAPGNTFVALVGLRLDAHAHVAAAVERGASIVVVSRPVELPASARVTVVLVADTTLALGALGRAHRRRWAARSSSPRRVVAITGSAGKTTTRRAVAALLTGPLGGDVGLRVHATTGNLNNAIGIPMVLLGLHDEHEVAVVEVGTSSRGEIAHGVSLVEPDVSVLTLVAAAHTEGIGSIDDVAREKGDIFAALGPGAVAVVNGDEPHAAAQLLRSPSRDWLVYGSLAGADVRLRGRAPDDIHGASLSFSLGERVRARGVGVGGLQITTPLLGVAGAYATAAAVAVCAALAPGMLGSEAASAAFAGLSEGASEGGRLSAERLPDGTVLIDDSYNANRASMVASLGTAAEIARARGKRLFAVLGEMRELGPLSAEEHREVGKIVAALGVGCLVAVAGDAARIAEVARALSPAAGEPGRGRSIEIVFVPDAQAAAEATVTRLMPGDVVLVKGSRSVGLEKVASAVATAAGMNPPHP
jgi:UDP-N-acetylmuramoyl-tripeptide--D-alanyl-D-alanine ligase